jgi:hypothetical protein
MARRTGDREVKPSKARLVSVDGVDASAVIAAARRAIVRPGRGGVSHWDASGIFQDLCVADAAAGAPSARTLLLLYAADLAFRLRWEIEPAIAEGKTVVAAPYIATAVAFGRAAGLTGGWLLSLFRFAPAPAMRSDVAVRLRSGAAPRGFVEVSARLAGGVLGLTRRQLIERAQARLKRL